jgi:arylsulfatase A-like enzyme
MDFGRKLAAGVLGGWVGGALVGLVEAMIVASVGGCEEFGVFGFGALAYGSIGAAMGLGWAVATLVLNFLGRDPESTLAGAGGVVVALMGLVVIRFRVVRDIFGENLPLGSMQGVLVHVGLILLAALAFYLLWRALLRSADVFGAEFAGGAWGLGLAVSGLAITFLLNSIAPTSVDEAPAVTAKGPNVVLILVDTLRADYTGPYGSTKTSTPAIDALAKDGVVFENAFAHSSWTRPSVATALTSLYPASHSVMHKTDLLPDGVVTVAEAFSEAGYRTSGFVTNINVAPSFHFDQGFHRYSYLAPAFFFGATDSGSKLSLYSAMRLIRERFLSKTKWVEQYYQDAATVNAMALPWVEENAPGPFFSFIHYMDPHDPYFEIPYNGKAIARVNTPHPDAARADELSELYADNIDYFDGFLAAVVESLKSKGLYDNTLVALIADHGEEFHEHGGWWHGTTLYDEQIHVPLIVKSPGAAKAGSRVSELAGLIDVAPTLAAIAGVPAPSSWQGRDLFSASPAPQAVYAEEDHEGNELESVRTAGWKLIVANAGNPRGLDENALYDLTKDPDEKTNLYDTNLDMAVEMEGHLESLRILAASSAVEGSQQEISDADQERLRALGYVE